MKRFDGANHSLYSISDTQAILLSSIAAYQLFKNNMLSLYPSGGEQITLQETPSIRAMIRELHALHPEWIMLPSGLHLRMDRLVATDKNSTSHIYLDAIAESVEGFLDPTMLNCKKWIRLPSGLSFDKDRLIAYEDHWQEDPAHAILYLSSGHEFWIRTTQDQTAFDFFYKEYYSSYFYKMTDTISVDLKSIVAWRRQYAGESLKNQTNWILYLGLNQQIDLGDQEPRLEGFFKTPTHVAFNLEKLVGYVYEQPRTELFEPRLGLYLREGHELNLYERSDVVATQAQLTTFNHSHWFTTDSMMKIDLSRHLFTQMNSDGRLSVTLKNGPGITMTEIQYKGFFKQ